MGILTGILPLGTYTSGVNLDTLLNLLPNPDAVPPRENAGGGLLDEISPAALAQLRVELTAMKGGFSQVAFGQYVVIAADDTANQINITTGLTDFDLANSAVLIFRAGAEITTAKTISKQAGGVIRIADSTYQATVGDVVNWIARKA